MEQREQVLAATPLPAQTPKLLDFAKFDEKSAAFAACPGRAEQFLAQLDAGFGEGEDALRLWLARAEATRRKLATLVGRAIG
jgi:hypothetical protein